MPDYVEFVRQPSAQDRSDLAKVYADAPAWLLAPHADADTLIAAGIASGRLIAASKITNCQPQKVNAAILGANKVAWQVRCTE